MIVESVRLSVNNQFPGLALFLFPGDSADSKCLILTVEDTWKVFRTYQYNKTETLHVGKLLAVLRVTRLPQIVHHPTRTTTDGTKILTSGHERLHGKPQSSQLPKSQPSKTTTHTGR